MHVINSLFPIFLLVLLGVFLRQSGFLPSGFFKGANRLTFRVGLPALLFLKIATAEFDMQTAGHIFSVLALATFTVIAIAYPLAHLLRIPEKSVGTFVQGAFRSNVAFVGLPVIFYLYGASGDDSATRAATLALAPMIPLVNILALAILQEQNPGKRRFGWAFFSGTVKNPLLIACIAGMVISIIDMPVPTMFQRGLQALASMALPLALLSIGSALKFTQFREHTAIASAAALLNVAVLPIIGFAFARLLGLSPSEIRIAIILLACPAASASYIMAQQMGGDAELAGNTILISTLLSAFSLWTTIALLG